MNEVTPDLFQEDSSPAAEYPTSSRINKLRSRLNRRTRKLEVATEALKMTRLATLYEMAEELAAEHPEAAAQVRHHILATEEIPAKFALAFEEVVSLAVLDEELDGHTDHQAGI